MLEHGGRLRQAALQYDRPIDDWLDLSTGINPDGWVVPALPEAVWSRLPEDNDGLEQAARDYYETDCLLPVAGSQAAIQMLPRLRSRGRVGVLAPGYAEHAHAWQRAGHEVVEVSATSVDELIDQLDVLVLINPNNPTGVFFLPDHLLQWHEQLLQRGGWLVVDEAFMDVTPEYSLTRYSPRTGLIVLRSLGKFFGLAGARVGFVCAALELLDQIRDLLGPWMVSAPARWVAHTALRDGIWQEETRWYLRQQGIRLHSLLIRHGWNVEGDCALFQWSKTVQAETIKQQLAQQGILIRVFDEPASLRLGLPGEEQGWLRLDGVLTGLQL
ncbi:MAG: threonine-phosphate decarboxylase [Gammaproteobacteria bacterium]|nr:threonine-phosphate decarboxylase [Gammaproteobacteria bacterium]